MSKTKTDRFAKLGRGIGPARLHRAITKNRMISIRVSEEDRDSMKRVAKKLGLTVTEYLTRLHLLMLEKAKNG